MTPYIMWPTTGTGADLAKVLGEAATDGTNRLSGSSSVIVEGYLTWVSNQVRMLQGRVTTGDLDRLLTSPRYWATFANPIPAPSTVSAVTEEILHRARLMNEAATALMEATEAWRPVDREYTNLVVVDTNFWVEQESSFDSIDWHELINSAAGPSTPAMQDELRLLVPMVVIDELDSLAHKGNLRSKVIGASRWLYKHLGGAPARPATLTKATVTRGVVTAQLLIEPHAHTRLPNNDDEIVETAVRLRDFLGHPPQQVFFLTYDAGAAFRAGHAGLMARLLTK
jgi:PIN domain